MNATPKDLTPMMERTYAANDRRPLFLMPSDRLGYALADQPSNPSYTPNPLYRWNAAGGGGVTVSRFGTGSYAVSFYGLDPEVIERGNAQVTAYGPGNAQCTVSSVGPEYVSVRCYQPNGSPVDAPFTVRSGHKDTCVRNSYALRTSC